MNYTLSQPQLLLFILSVLTACGHLTLAAIGFFNSRAYRAQRLYFSICLAAMGWSVFWVAFVNAGISIQHPTVSALSTLFSGLISIAFFLYCKTITHPKERPSPRWLLFAAPGVLYCFFATFYVPNGLDYLQQVINGERPSAHPILTPLFALHSSVLLGFSIASVVLVIRAKKQAPNPLEQEVLNWLSRVFWVGLVILLLTNVAPLFGDVSMMHFQALLTIPIALLMHRSLAAIHRHHQVVWDEKQARRERIESLGRMARGVAHDFNNLLTSITGHVELAQIKSTKNQDPKEHFVQILSNLEHAANLQRKLLAFSTNQSGPLEPIDPGPIFQSIAAEIKTNLPKNLEFKVKIPRKTRNLRIRSTDLYNSITNLLRNAMESMQEKPGTIAFRVWEEEDATLPDKSIGTLTRLETVLVIEIKDTGSGISPDMTKNLFEPFHSTKGTGRGLGLSSVLAAVQSAGGAVSFQSALAEGSAFRIWLPTTTAPPVSTPEKAPDGNLAKNTICLVDDDPKVLKVLEQILQHLGQDVTPCLDPTEALRLMQEDPQRFHRALIDVQMPQMSGITLSKKLLAINPSIHISLMSGAESQHSIDRAFPRSPPSFLRKPITIDALKSFCTRETS